MHAIITQWKVVNCYKIRLVSKDNKTQHLYLFYKHGNLNEYYLNEYIIKK